MPPLTDAAAAAAEGDGGGCKTKRRRGAIIDINRKTELCRNLEDKGSCLYGDNCAFAHGVEELRYRTSREMQYAGRIPDATRYRSHPCMTWVATGSCSYDRRCVFIHDPRVKGTHKVELHASCRAPLADGCPPRAPCFSFPDVHRDIDSREVPTHLARYDLDADMDTITNVRHRRASKLWGSFVSTFQDPSTIGGESTNINSYRGGDTCNSGATEYSCGSTASTHHHPSPGSRSNSSTANCSRTTNRPSTITITTDVGSPARSCRPLSYAAIVASSSSMSAAAAEAAAGCGRGGTGVVAHRTNQPCSLPAGMNTCASYENRAALVRSGAKTVKQHLPVFEGLSKGHSVPNPDAPVLIPTLHGESNGVSSTPTSFASCSSPLSPSPSSWLNSSSSLSTSSSSPSLPRAMDSTPVERRRSSKGRRDVSYFSPDSSSMSDGSSYFSALGVSDSCVVGDDVGARGAVLGRTLPYGTPTSTAAQSVGFSRGAELQSNSGNINSPCFPRSHRWADGYGPNDQARQPHQEHMHARSFSIGPLSSPSSSSSVSLYLSPLATSSSSGGRVHFASPEENMSMVNSAITAKTPKFRSPEIGFATGTDTLRQDLQPIFDMMRPALRTTMTHIENHDAAEEAIGPPEALVAGRCRCSSGYSIVRHLRELQQLQQQRQHQRHQQQHVDRFDDAAWTDLRFVAR